MSRIITDWNNTKQDYPKNKNLIKLIEEQAEFSAEKIACIYAKKVISFKQLNRSANQLAHFIQQNVKGTGNYIFIHLDRDIQSVVTILAILKSGNIYVPIDPNSSPQAIKQLVDRYSIAAIISNKNLNTELTETFSNKSIASINVAKQQQTITQMPQTNLNLSSYPKEAYVLFTSGTTGQPKGVQISQNSLLNLLYAMRDIVSFDENDRFLAITPITFDISAIEFYLPLLFGGSFIFADTETRYNPYKIIASIDKYAVTIMQATPVTWQMLVDSEWQNSNKIKMLCGGEGLSTILASKLSNTKSPLWNFYGPTETTIWSTYHKVKNIDKSKPYIAIGKPLANTEIFVLDENLNQVANGAHGELYIGGEGVALGYLDNPTLTNKSFINSNLSETKIYKTGDIVYFCAKNFLHFVGRVDTQIKIRGHRVEIEAIEHILKELPEINDGVIIAEQHQKTKILVAYLRLKSRSISLQKINNHLKSHFPDYMIPAKFIEANEFPLTSSGKIDRKKVPSQPNLGEISEGLVTDYSLENKFEKVINNIICKFVEKPHINPTSHFQDIGIHSMGLVSIANSINEKLNLTINVIDLINYPTIRSFTKYLFKNQNLQINQQLQKIPDDTDILETSKRVDTDIAIIGIACKFPGADNYNEFWELILNKKNNISFFNNEELHNSGVTADLINESNYVPARGIINDADKFDAKFFGIAPIDAKLMDPQHRIFLEQSWSALEDAGYAPDNCLDKVSVFAGMNDSSYLQNQILKNSQVLNEVSQQQIMLATSPHYLATKVSYNLGLQGLSMTINTACSTGLVAIDLAVENLQDNKSNMAIAGAVNIAVPQKSGYVYRELGILSPDGQCNAFSDSAKGTVISNGCGVVVLKRLKDALRDNDNIYAVIKGSASNNDGATKSGFTSPSIDGQVACVQEAIKRANINPTELEFIEAHGTGTLVGDPIEVYALSQGYKYHKYKKSSYCAIGSVKPNIGHTDTAAGIAGFIKATLAVYHKTIPTNINFSKANHQINFGNTPFYVSQENTPWNTKHKLRTAAVNSLGFGGTNAHIILQEPVKQVQTSSSKSSNVILLSAKVAASLKTATANLKKHLYNIQTNKNADKILADTSYTLQIGRSHYQHRMAIAYSNLEQLLDTLNSPKELNNHSSSLAKAAKRKIVFGFVGQGSQYVSMAYDIYTQQPVFKKVVDECFALIEQEIQVDLKKILFPQHNSIDKASSELIKTQNAQPCLFVIEYALAKLLISLGIEPTGMIGHSLGEYVAATIAGVFNINDAIKLIIARSKLMAKTKPGVMLAIPLSKDKIQPYLNQSIDLAAQNAPNLCVVSGSKKDISNFIDKVQPILAASNLNYQYLHTAHAFHSQYMDPILDEFLDAIKGIKFQEPNIPFISNISGKWITKQDINSKKYWASHMRNAVLFSDGISNLELSPEDIFIEIGPGSTLSQLILQHKCHKPHIFNTIPHYVNANDNSYETFLNTVSKLWLLNVNINWADLYKGEQRRREHLPTYPFTKQSHWIYPTSANSPRNSSNGLYVTTWERGIKLIEPESKIQHPNQKWLVFSNEQSLINGIENQADNVYQVSFGKSLQKLNEHSYIINPKVKKHYLDLLKAINPQAYNINVVHTFLTAKDLQKDETLYHGPYCLLYLSQAFNELYAERNLNIIVLTKSLYNVFGDESTQPCKASILGPCKVIPQEHQNIKIRLVDLAESSKVSPKIITNLVHEVNDISNLSFKDEIAYRGNYRWKRKLNLGMQELMPVTNRLKSKGVYVITGGLGGIGLAIAEYLALHYNANIILMNRSTVIPSHEWASYLAEETNRSLALYPKLNKLNNIKKNAASLTLLEVKVEDKDKLQSCIQLIKQRFQHINGVIHAAGIPGKGVSYLKSISDYQQVLIPKLYGTEYLIESLKNEKLDFLALCSSITAITGFPGQVDYCSANRILDSYVDYAQSKFKHNVFCTTLNWQAWRDVGMAAESQTMLINLDESNSITPEEGCKVFAKVINSSANQVVISNTDLNFYDHQALNLAPQVKPPAFDFQDTNENLSHTTKTLLDIWRSVLGVTSITIDDDFYELGGNSLLAIGLIAKIRERFTVNIPSTVLFKTRTISSLAELIESHKNHINDSSPLVTLKEGAQSKAPIFFVHPIGGTVFCYLELVKALQTDRTIYAFQDPSIECGKNLFQSIESQATLYRTIIQKTQKNGPYYLCGASFGATIIMEIAHQLQKNKELVGFIGLIDGWGKINQNKPCDKYIDKLINLHSKGLSDTTNMMDKTLWNNLVKHRLKIMQKHIYKKITAPIYLYKATEILPEYRELNTKDNHWSDFSALPVSISNIPGDHNTMLEQPNVAVLAEKIQSGLKSLIEEPLVTLE